MLFSGTSGNYVRAHEIGQRATCGRLASPALDSEAFLKWFPSHIYRPPLIHFTVLLLFWHVVILIQSKKDLLLAPINSFDMNLHICQDFVIR